jgi:DegV family protein with EDD domain
MTTEEDPTGDLRTALRAGHACTVAWAELLDRINVFPVADGDTGRNMVVSLAPLRDQTADDATVAERLLLSARGNSGNIACAFVRTLLDSAGGESLAARCIRGAEFARRAVAIPQPGTMLTVLDAFAAKVDAGLSRRELEDLLSSLAQVVSETTHAQATLRLSNVVDSGALGMLVFLDGMLRVYFGLGQAEDALAGRFRSLISFQRGAAAVESETGFCVDVVVRGPRPSDAALSRIGSEVVVLNNGDLWKIHLHAPDVEVARAALGRLGEIVRWSWDDLHEQMSVRPAEGNSDHVHVMTDGASSLSRREAEALGITLLDSHVNLRDLSLPETRLDPEDVYSAMRRGVRVSTSQASTYERHKLYERVSSQWKSVLYLCVGSVYTGNHAVASAWQASHPAGKHLTVVDSGAASGRLAVVARATALAARDGRPVEALADFARTALHRAEEYIFLECLEYLARGGRMSKAGAFFGDALHLAPVVSPLPDGARKVALLRKQEDKLAFACARARQALEPTAGRGYLLLQHSDNRAWVVEQVLPRLRAEVPAETEIAVGPLSLTTGVHTGPGTWALAILSDLG